MWKLQALFTFFVSLGITAFIIPKILLISFRKQLFDFNDGRKVHTGIVPRLGGVAFTPAIVIAIALLLGIHTAVLNTESELFRSPKLGLGLCALLLLYFEGIADDLVGIGYKGKFLMQLLAASLLVLSGLWINDFYGLFGLYALPVWFGYPLTVVIVVFIINAINLIDGIDGLASGLSMIAMFFFACLFLYEGQQIYTVLSLVTLGTLIPFFRYNVFGKAEKHRKIFMGDTGSQTIGFIAAILAIRLSYNDPAVSPRVPNSILVAFSLLLVPCFDVIRVMIHRMRRGKNPFMPDQNHIHHKFLALGMSHHTAMLIILAISAFFALLNISLQSLLNINIILVMDIMIWTVFHLWLSKMIRNRKTNTLKNAQ